MLKVKVQTLKQVRTIKKNIKDKVNNELAIRNSVSLASQ